MTFMESCDKAPASSAPLILKTDVLGRVLTPRTRREELMAEFDRSGLTARRFCELVGINYQTFAGWLHYRRKAQSSQSPSENGSQQVAWLEAVVGDAHAMSRAASAALLLMLPGGARAEVTSQQQIHLAAALLRALEKPC